MMGRTLGSHISHCASRWACDRLSTAGPSGWGTVSTEFDLLQLVLEGGLEVTPGQRVTAPLPCSSILVASSSLLCLLTQMCMCLWSSLPGRRILWLNIRGKEAAILSMFHVSMPLPGVSSCMYGRVGGALWHGQECQQALAPPGSLLRFQGL